MAKIGRPKLYERTVKIALTAEQWERLDLEAVIMDVAFADAVRMNIEEGFRSTSTTSRTEETEDA